MSNACTGARTVLLAAVALPAVSLYLLDASMGGEPFFHFQAVDALQQVGWSYGVASTSGIVGLLGVYLIVRRKLGVGWSIPVLVLAGNALAARGIAHLYVSDMEGASKLPVSTSAGGVVVSILAMCEHSSGHQWIVDNAQNAEIRNLARLTLSEHAKLCDRLSAQDYGEGWTEFSRYVYLPAEDLLDGSAGSGLPPEVWYLQQHVALHQALIGLVNRSVEQDPTSTNLSRVAAIAVPELAGLRDAAREVQERAGRR